MDSQRGEECDFRRTADGVLRCLPDGPTATYSRTYFADSGCTQPLANASCPPTYAFEFLATCPSQVRVHALGAQFSGTVYFKSGASCTAVPGASGIFYRVGAEVTPAMFVAGDEDIP